MILAGHSLGAVWQVRRPIGQEPMRSRSTLPVYTQTTVLAPRDRFEVTTCGAKFLQRFRTGLRCQMQQVHKSRIAMGAVDFVECSVAIHVTDFKWILR